MTSTDGPSADATGRPSSPWRQLALAVPIYLACLLLAGLLWPRPMLLVALAAALSVVFLRLWSERQDWIYYGVPFVLGPVGESIAVHLGAWSYTNTALIPLWLPFLWGLAGLFMRRATVALCLIADRKGSTGNG